MAAEQRRQAMDNDWRDGSKKQVFGFDKNIFFAGLTSFLEYVSYFV